MDTEQIKTASAEQEARIAADVKTSIMDAGDGMIKDASAPASNMLRRRIRESGFARRIIPPETKQNSDLDRAIDHERPIIIEEMEPLSPGAKSMPFGDSADSTFYRGNKYACVFHQISTPEFVKDINELRTYKSDVRKVITDNALNDVETKEDGEMIAGFDEIVGASNGVGASGLQQNFVLTGGFTRENYNAALSLMDDFELNIGCVLINRKTARQFVGFGRDEIGGDLSQDLFKSGLQALQESVIMGVKHVITIKQNLVPFNTIYLCTEPSYLGRFYSLQDLVMYVERKKDILKVSARETISMTVANVKGVIKVTFQ